METKPSPWQEQQALLLSELSLYLPPSLYLYFFILNFYVYWEFAYMYVVYHLYGGYLQRLEKGIISLELEF